jgi:hypothetical protein
MRATPQTLELVRTAVAPLDTAERRAAYLAGEFPRAEFVKDLDTRYRWDLLYAANRLGEPPVLRVLSDEGLNSEHIDTVLRRVVPVLAN